MKRIYLSLTLLLMFAACPASASISIPGADSIHIRDYFDASITTSLKQPVTTSIVSGTLPFGLRLSADNRIIGYPTAVMNTSAVLSAKGANGKIEKQKIVFRVVDDKFRLLYRELPVAKIGKQISVKIEGQGGTPPYSGCKIERVRVFTNGGAAKPGAKAPETDSAPQWLSLKPDCTLTAKPDIESIVLMVISAHDKSGASANEFYALRSASNPASRGWLETKARAYNKDYQNRFSPYGLTLELSPTGAFQSYGDSAIWTGTYLAGAAYYYAVTHEDYARKNVEKALSATTQLREITGVPGLIARAYQKDEWVGRQPEPDIKNNPANHSYYIESGPWKGWSFLSTASRDQFTGVFWGDATVWELFDNPDWRRRASENIISMAAHIWDNKMHIMDADGKHTRHGVMSGYGIQDSEGEVTYDPYTGPMRVPNGFNGALDLNWFDMAAGVAPDAKTRDLWRTRYLNLIATTPNPEPGRTFEYNYLSNLRKLYVFGLAYNKYYETVWFNLNLLFNNYYHLIRFEKDPKFRQKYRDVLRFLWEDAQPMKDGCEAPEARRVAREGNPHFTWQYLAAMGDREPDRIFDAVSSLIAFPNGPRAPYKIVDPIDIRAVPGHPDWACEPVPIQYRRPQDFQWQRSPYDTDLSWSPSENGRNFPGVDVITPYWMGRYYGFIPSYL